MEYGKDLGDTMHADLDSFVLGNNKRIKNIFVCAPIGFIRNNVYYSDTDSLYIEKKH